MKANARHVELLQKLQVQEDEVVEEFIMWFIYESLQAGRFFSQHADDDTVRSFLMHEWKQYRAKQRTETLRELTRITQELGLEY